MKQVMLILIAAGMTLTAATAQLTDVKNVKSYEYLLDDVTELLDSTVVKLKMTQVETDYERDKSGLNTVRFGLIYHEAALTMAFLAKSSEKGYAQKSYDLLNGLFLAKNITPQLRPVIASYRASARALIGAETKKLSHLSVAFNEFDAAIKAYSLMSPYPEFLRGSVAENLPWFFIRKRRLARIDFASIIKKQAQNPNYANWKLMSFTYWGWANQHQSTKDRAQAILYLDKAIALDPTYLAGRQRAEALKSKLLAN